MDVFITELQCFFEKCLQLNILFLTKYPECAFKKLLEALINLITYVYQCSLAAYREAICTIPDFFSMNPHDQLWQLAKYAENYHAELLKADSFQKDFAACVAAYANFLRDA